MTKEDFVQDVALARGTVLGGSVGRGPTNLSEPFVPTTRDLHEVVTYQAGFNGQSLPPEPPRQLVQLLGAGLQLGDSHHPLGRSGRVYRLRTPWSAGPVDGKTDQSS